MPNPVRQSVGPDPEVLTEVLSPDVNLAVWERGLPHSVSQFAKAVLASGRGLSEAHVLEVEEDQAPALAMLAQGFADTTGHADFLADVAWLVHAYCCLTGARRVGLRLRTLSKAMCPRYHVDWVSLRLITTYSGIGSQWLAEGDMGREGLGNPAAEPAMAPRQIDEGSVALFKGERWEGNEGCGIIHRSPAIEDGSARLIMTVDWLK